MSDQIKSTFDGNPPFDPTNLKEAGEQWRKMFMNEAFYTFFRSEIIAVIIATYQQIREHDGCPWHEASDTVDSLKRFDRDPNSNGCCCPLCDEITCDAGCPLEQIRSHPTPPTPKPSENPDALKNYNIARTVAMQAGANPQIAHEVGTLYQNSILPFGVDSIDVEFVKIYIQARVEGKSERDAELHAHLVRGCLRAVSAPYHQQSMPCPTTAK